MPISKSGESDTMLEKLIFEGIELALDRIQLTPDRIHTGRIIRFDRRTGVGFIHADQRDVFFHLRNMHIPVMFAGRITFRKATDKERRRVKLHEKFAYYVLGEDIGRGPRSLFWYLQSHFEEAIRQTSLGRSTH